MNIKKYHVLVVDDSLLELELTAFLLSQYYQVTTAISGEDALALIQTHKPTVVVLDVNMPGIDGYEVCRRIREYDQLVKVIFVSANNTTEEILRAYDSGGDDYLVKPFNPDIFLSKIHQAISRSVESVKKSQNFEEIAMEAMTSLGEFGTIISFLKSSFHAANLHSLATLSIDFLGRFNLHACLQLRTETHRKNYETYGLLTPIEEELLVRTSSMNGRIVERGKRMFINYNNASLIIKNMPVYDDFKMGRLRDCLAIMLESVDEKMSQLSIEEETEEALNFIQSVHKRIEIENSEFITKTIRQIEVAFTDMGMTEEQENSLIGLIKKSQSDFEKNFTDTALIEKHVSNILKKIKSRSDATTPNISINLIDMF